MDGERERDEVRFVGGVGLYHAESDRPSRYLIRPSACRSGSFCFYSSSPRTRIPVSFECT